jgi:5'-methylthioadenosine phosphorylase
MLWFFTLEWNRVGMQIAVIGGSGFYRFFEGEARQNNTPYGESSPITEFQVDGETVFFLPRHGKGHSVPPHLVNYRANIYALHELEVTHIVATNAVGSCRKKIEAGHIVVPDQLIDSTVGRASTFFVGDSDEDIPPEFKTVQHTDVSYPYAGEVRQTLIDALAAREDTTYHSTGTYVCNNGPRFETAAEVNMARLLGGHLLGMTSAPEAFLARELDMDYATICLVTNYGAGMQDSISHEEVLELFNERIEVVRDIILDCTRTLLSMKT